MIRLFKNNYKYIIGFILGIILASTTIYAANISFLSSDVDHTKLDGTTTTVENALNDLYEKANSTSNLTVVGTYSGNQSLDLATLGLEGKQASDFIIITNSFYNSQIIIANNYGSVSVNYSPATITSVSNGKLNITGASIQVRGTGSNGSYSSVGTNYPNYVLYVLN